MTLLRNQLITVIALLIFSNSGIAQGINGKITDQQKQTIAGAYVFLKNNDHHTHTNALGFFELDEAKVGDTLVITHVGYKTHIQRLTDLSQNLLIKLDDQIIELSNVTVTPSLDAINLFTKIDLGITPVSSSQEILKKVPGLVLGQHAGGGKAEQIFLRGFDIDHGTDIDITVDGLPVNMVSHAHGQGYADLHFLIPETIEKIDFGKGPYSADHGNFTTAGYVGFQTKEQLSGSSLKLEYGSFNSKRVVGLFNLISTDDESAYIATEYSLNDGPFESSQNFSRINLMGKYTKKLANNDKIGFLFSHFDSQWDASGQIPQRLVDDGTLTRFGAVDDTEGGFTGRTNFKVDYSKNLDTKSYIKSSFYVSEYDFELYSNFTFFLLDSVNGDQIKQKENRRIFGLNSEWGKFFDLGSATGLLKVGAGFRNDLIEDVELSHTANRTTTLEEIQKGNIDETNLFAYASAEFEFDHWLINPAVRIDGFDFNYQDQITPAYDPQSESKAFVSPKLNILYNRSENLQYYLKTGIGFHSNDTRVVVARNGEKIIPGAYGADVGIIWKPIPKILINTALWTLRLEQEFVYVGDAGIVEPSGRSSRNGVDFGIRYQIANSLFLYSDINYAHARSIDEAEGNDRIPLAPSLTATGGINVVNFKGFSGGLRMRMLTDRPANEDNSIIAKGYMIVDWNVNYNFGDFNIDFAIMNLLNQEWNETQFATESRLQNEDSSVEEIHFTPGAPISARASITYKF